MRIPIILVISLASVLAGSLLLVGPFLTSNTLPADQVDVQEAEATVLPLMIRDRFTEKQLAGDAEAGSRFLRVIDEFIDPENHCEFCTRVEYTPGPQGVAGFAYESNNAVDFIGAKKVRFWVMGEEGDERIRFKVAGRSLDRIQDRLGQPTDRLERGIFESQRFALTTEEVTLDDEWKKYEVDLTGVNLQDITHPFAFELSRGNGGQTQIVYIKGVVYDDESAEEELAIVEEQLVDPLSAGIISNGTEGVAPATFEFEANVTGGTEPYDIAWNFGDEGESAEGNVSHTFVGAGTYNVTLEVTDAGNQTAADSLEMLVEEPEVGEELLDNDTEDVPANVSSGANASSSVTEEEEVSTETIEDIELQVEAGIDIVAQPGDTVVLGGEVTVVGANASEDLSQEWTQESGPEVEIDGTDSLNPTVTIPDDLEEDEEIELELVASLGPVEASDSITVFVQHIDEVEDAQEETRNPSEAEVTEWDDECDDLVDCMSDGSDSTFAAASPDDVSDVNLFAFEEFDAEDIEIAYVTAMATARTDETGYLLFAGSDDSDAQDYSESPGAISIVSDSFQDYEYVWEENPVTGDPWTVESLNSFLAGYAYAAGESDIEVSEFSLVVTYTVEELPEEAENLAEQLPEQSNNDTATNSTGE